MAAEELLESEMELNEEVHFKAKGTCARYMGCCEIDPRNEGELYNGTLTSGKNLYIVSLFHSLVDWVVLMLTM